MRKSLFAIAGSMLIGGAGVALADTTTTTTWTTDQGNAIREYSTTKHYSSVTDPALHPSVGTVLPNSVTVYPMPDTVKVPTTGQYSYSIINEHPVVVDSTRHVVHTW